MSFSIFPHAQACPSDEEVCAALGPAAPLWRLGLQRLAEAFGAGEPTWHSYGRASGWSLNVKDRTGTLAYFYPQRGGFIVVVNVGTQAAERARALVPLADGVEAAIAGGRPYPKGRTVATDVCNERDVDLVVALCRVVRAG